MTTVVSWSPEQFEARMRDRIYGCREHRRRWEAQWSINHQAVFNRDYSYNDDLIEIGNSEDDLNVDSTIIELKSSYIRRYVRVRHGMLMSYPPVAEATPASAELNDRQSAEAADKILQHAMRHHKISRVLSKTLNSTLTYSVGWVKSFWDPFAGEVKDFNKVTGAIQLKGEMSVKQVPTRDIWMDPLAKHWEDVRYVYQRIWMTLEEAKQRYPNQDAKLLAAVSGNNGEEFGEVDRPTTGEEIIAVYEYWEKKAPINGMVGRFVTCTETGQLLERPKPNPHPNGELPFYPFFDDEAPDDLYGRSLVEYSAKQQELINKIDQAIVRSIETFGKMTLAVPIDSKVTDGMITNDPTTIIHYDGGVPPHALNPPSLPPEMFAQRNQLKEDVQENFGINDAQLGVIQRETSGFSQQTSIESGNVFNRSFFDQFTCNVEKIWIDYLSWVKVYWTDEHTIKVVGANRKTSVHKFKGSDLAGGFDIRAEYGNSLPLDPNMRREQIMLLLEPLQTAGYPMERILQLLRLNELGPLYDEQSEAEQRQLEIYEAMEIGHKKGFGSFYIAPKPNENHEQMVKFCRRYRMSPEYKALPPEVKEAVDRHHTEREALLPAPPQADPTGGGIPPLPML